MHYMHLSARKEKRQSKIKITPFKTINNQHTVVTNEFRINEDSEDSQDNSLSKAELSWLLLNLAFIRLFTVTALGLQKNYPFFSFF